MRSLEAIDWFAPRHIGPSPDERDAMLQTPAPLAWREAELEYLRKALNLKGEGLI